MEIKFSKNIKKNQALVFLVSESLNFSKELKDIDQKSDKLISRAIKFQNFKGKTGQTIDITAPKDLNCELITIIGTGKEKNLSQNDAQSIGGKIYTKVNSNKSSSACICVGQVKDPYIAAANIAYGIKLKSYRFDKYKTKQEDDKLPTFKKTTIVCEGHGNAETLFDKFDKVAEGVFLSRDVVTEPPNILYPQSYADIVKGELNISGATVKVLDRNAMHKLGMGALLGVAQGSEKEARLVVIEYNGSDKKDPPIAFVGKGVTFDTGGISLKPSLGMEDMKYDMGGSAAVVGVMKALAGRKAKINAVGVIGLVENMPGSNAQRPSDVVTSMSGQTVEVLNTDAEGRLVLCDALTYCQETFKPKVVIDLATLTGAIVIALGDQYAGLFTNSDKLAKQLSAAGSDTNERVWRFPLGEEYDKLLDSPIADMQNISSGRGAGSITAAQFLQRFIKDGVEWCHLDIAGVAWTKEEKDICPKGATGFGVRLLDRFVSDNYEGK
ncbi:leucyl aminopeptidase [Rickettsiales bacterium]|nr:leucyl aminopeptidase [Rickettsiales bacterium]